MCGLISKYTNLQYSDVKVLAKLLLISELFVVYKLLQEDKIELTDDWFKGYISKELQLSMVRYIDYMNICVLEAGHWVIAELLGYDLLYVSAIKGHTCLARVVEKYRSRTSVECDILVALAGRQAELIVYGDVFKASRSDYLKVRNMVFKLMYKNMVYDNRVFRDKLENLTDTELLKLNNKIKEYELLCKKMLEDNKTRLLGCVNNLKDKQFILL